MLLLLIDRNTVNTCGSKIDSKSSEDKNLKRLFGLERKA